MKQTVFVVVLALIATCSLTWGAVADFSLDLEPSQESITAAEGEMINMDLIFNVTVATEIDEVSGYSFGVMVDEEAAGGLSVNITEARAPAILSEAFANQMLLFEEDAIGDPAETGPCYLIADECDPELDLSKWVFILDTSVPACLELLTNPDAVIVQESNKIIANCSTTDIANGIAFGQGVILSQDLSLTLDVANSPLLSVQLIVHVEGEAAEGQQVKIDFADSVVNTPPIANVVAWDNKSFTPDVQGSGVVDVNLIVPTDVGVPGDAGGDCRIDIADPINIINALFRDGELPCEAAADVNNDMELNLADVVYLLEYLFNDGPAPANPEEIPADHPLSCENPADCPE